MTIPRTSLLMAAALAAAASAWPLLAADMVVVVGPKCRVTSITTNQLADIYLGRSPRLPDGTPAMPVDLPEGVPVRDAFYLSVTGKSPAQVKAFWSKMVFTGKGQPPREALNAAEMKQLLAANPGAIGYLDRSLVDRELRTVTLE